MKLQLPDVTLVMMETREHALACLAVEDCVKLADFGDVLILTDRPLEFSSLTNLCRPRIHTIEDSPDKIGWARSLWDIVPPLLKTSHNLFIQWDSWIWDTSMWRGVFLNYDYIGAPWWYKDGKNVGNSGFSLKSTALVRYLRDRARDYPCSTDVEDDLLCRKYRPVLESAGFVWAPEKIANQFAFECVRPSATSRHFGFHGAFNFGAVLDQARLEERVSLMTASPYISNPDGYIWKAFCAKNPELASRGAS